MTGWATCRSTTKTSTPTTHPPRWWHCGRRPRPADAALVVTPEYNASIPGVLKNAIDWLSRPFGNGALKDKPLAVIGASFGQYGGVWAQRRDAQVVRGRRAPGGGVGQVVGAGQDPRRQAPAGECRGRRRGARCGRQARRRGELTGLQNSQKPPVPSCRRLLLSAGVRGRSALFSAGDVGARW